MTHFTNDAGDPDKTDKTYPAGNIEFLKAIFEPLESDIKPILVSFAGNPNKVPKGKWFGKAWTPEAADLPSHFNNYFSLAAFRPDDSGKYRRQKKHFSALYAVMLDDVGTKVEHERLTLPPSWLLETSPGNYQAGYILAEPITAAKTADNLMNAIVAAHLCDPGAGGPTARLARLPLAVNGKTDPAFQCRIEDWQPDRRYGFEELVNGLELDMKPTERPKKKGQKQAERPAIGDDVFVPRPEENTVIAALKSKGLYKETLGGGKHDITCPWVTEHTDSVDGGTAYFEPDDTFPIGGFHCFHGHCEKRRIHDLLQYLEIAPDNAHMKATIRSIAGEIHKIADKAEQELASSGKHFQRGGLIVTITTDPGTRETIVKDISQNSLTSALSGASYWQRYDARSQDWVRIDPPGRVVSIVHDATDYRHLPALNGIARQPYLREDGTLAHEPGYDAATGMYGVFDMDNFSIPEAPSKSDAEKALAFIEELLAEFFFAQDSDKAAALSAILTAAIRPSLPLAPMYHVRAPQISSGKSFLCEIIAAFASASRSAPSAFPQDDEECRKFLLSQFLRAPAVIEFDNLTSDIMAHKSLCTALTSGHLTDRILGASRTATVSTRSLVLSSGNNVGPIQDMVRRCITINLDPGCENPASREFKNPYVLQDLLKNREKYVSAALTIIRAWIAAERPETQCKALASYNEWSELCRQPLLWLGLSDPTASLFTAMNDDPERETLGRLLHAWRDCFGTAPKMVRQIVDLAYGNNEELREILQDIAGERDTINRKRLGHWIKRHQNRIVDNMRFVRDPGSFSAAAWRVESVLSVSSEF